MKSRKKLKMYDQEFILETKQLSTGDFVRSLYKVIDGIPVMLKPISNYREGMNYLNHQYPIDYETFKELKSVVIKTIKDNYSKFSFEPKSITSIVRQIPFELKDKQFIMEIEVTVVASLYNADSVVFETISILNDEYMDELTVIFEGELYPEIKQLFSFLIEYKHYEEFV